MRDAQVVEVVRRVFEADGIWPDVVQSKSMFLLIPHMFAHIVLSDASKYEMAVEALQRIHISLKARHEEFRWKLRSSWKIFRAE